MASEKVIHATLSKLLLSHELKSLELASVSTQVAELLPSDAVHNKLVIKAELQALAGGKYARSASIILPHLLLGIYILPRLLMCAQ